MINTIEIRNFKCFESTNIERCRRINVLVGDNGSGKTALLEAVFLALGAASDLAQRYRTQRGMDSSFRGTPQRIASALFDDLFFQQNFKIPISINLIGTGEEARSIKIIRNFDGPPILFHWKDSKGGDHPVVPISANVDLPNTGEDLPDFFFFASNQTYPAVENAERFSDLSRAKRQKPYVETFSKEYPWIEGLDIEVLAGAPAVYASISGLADKIALPNVSGGINRFGAILAAIASRRKSVILVDEMENGLYYKHQRKYWETIIKFSRQYECQLFTTTHSEEWLRALASALDGEEPQDIALWRIERNKKNRTIISQFEGEQMIAGIAAGGVR